jgi:hypothetical protein
MIEAQMPQTANNPAANNPATGTRAVVGPFFLITRFLAGPSHLVITISLAIALLSGTTVGGCIAAYNGAPAMGASI